MKRNLFAEQVATNKAEIFFPILKILYSYEYEDEPEYNKIVFMFEKMLLDLNITPSQTNLEWVKEEANNRTRFVSNESIDENIFRNSVNEFQIDENNNDQIIAAFWDWNICELLLYLC